MDWDILLVGLGKMLVEEEGGEGGPLQ